MTTVRTDQLKKLMEEVKTETKDHPEWGEFFASTYARTLQEDLIETDEGIFVSTGDISAMWQRDSSLQMMAYLPLVTKDESIRNIIKQVIERQMKNLLLDPYANAFNLPENLGKHYSQDQPPLRPEVWERKYELDSLTFPFYLAYRYWQLTKDEEIFTETFQKALKLMIETIEIEQHHSQSSYSFLRETDRKEENLPHNGKGLPFKEVGLVWSAFRPSDDAATYAYSIPANLFLASVLESIQDWVESGQLSQEIGAKMQHIQFEIEEAIETYGIVEHEGKKIYAYEVDGLGNRLLMDDANLPSLLGLPYLDVLEKTDDLFQNTKAFILSENNPYYYKGKYGGGIGSSHTFPRYIWPIALAVEGLVSPNKEEKKEILDRLVQTSAGTQMMHESFDVDQPSNYTREWFSWANAMFNQLLLDTLDKNES